MDYTDFLTYPLQILGIDENYNSEIEAMKNLAIDEINYSGDVSDIEPVLPYFVFWLFCENKRSQVVANVGENAQVKEFSYQTMTMQVVAWNIGAKKLREICAEKNKTASEHYQSERNLIW